MSALEEFEVEVDSIFANLQAHLEKSHKAYMDSIERDEKRIQECINVSA